MDTILTTTFVIPDWISAGLTNGVYERVGGVIREVATKRVVLWLREGFPRDGGGLPLPPIGLPVVDPVTGGLKLAASLVNAGVSMKGFHDVNVRLDDVNQQLGVITNNLHQMQGMLQLSSAASILNLGVSVIGFAVVLHHITELEKRLNQAQEMLSKINRKIDLGFYAKFRAALDLAMNAFTMNKPENRRSSALQAIDRFLEAEHIYLDYVDQELAQRSQIADEYLLTLSLAYIAEARCYLELEEGETALRRYEEGSKKLRDRVKQYVELLLTSNPAAYLDPQFKGQIDLNRMTRIHQWIDPTLDSNAVFDLYRDHLFAWAKDQGSESGYKWIKALPPAIVACGEVKGSILGNREEMKQEAMNRLPGVLDSMESMIETSNRFESYQSEIKAIAQLGISFRDWTQLTSAKEEAPSGANLIYIIPAEPIAA